MREIELVSFDFDQIERVDLTNQSNNITGTQQGELLIGTSSSEPILGLGGDDVIVGKDGNDTLSGGAGNDSLETGRGNNLLLGNDGNDTLIASNNRLEGAGNNVFSGGAGNDIVLAYEGNDLIAGGAGIDVISGSGGNDIIQGGSGIDVINGGAGDDSIDGGEDVDELEGGDGNDFIWGGNDSDLLKGLEGIDTLNGGAGADFFYLIPNTGRDVIADFANDVDKLVLSPTSRFDSELTFEQLSITQSNQDTIIAIAETNETLAIIQNTSSSAINRDDFIQDEESESESTISADLDISDLPSQEFRTKIANQTEVASETTDNPGIGQVTSQGAEVVNASEARNRFGVDGTGVTVGVLSDSFDRSQLFTVTAEDDITTGDLPGANNPNGYTTPVRILDDSADNSLFIFAPQPNLSLVDEGRAMIQIIHDIAPGANILFHTAVKNSDDFARGIDELVAAGADIIVDDLLSGNEPFFQDGVVAQAANRAFEAGVPYFSASRNEGRNSYEADFRPTTESNLDLPALERYSFHDFDPSDNVDLFQNITLEPGAGINLSFQWDEPFASAGGKATSNDLDIFLLDANNQVVAIGAESNVGKDAVESIGFTNSTGAAAEYRLLIGQDTLAGGAAPSKIKYIDTLGGTAEAEYFTNSATTVGHPNAEGVFAVGASFYQTPQQLELFSSGGVVPILFDEQGNRLPEPELRQTPDIIAPNNVNTTFFFEGIDPEGDGFPNFPGTSAAAPHAAGVAALLLDAFPDATPQQIYGALEQTAIDLDNPYTSEFDTGFDTATGFGLIQADLALESLSG